MACYVEYVVLLATFAVDLDPSLQALSGLTSLIDWKPSLSKAGTPLLNNKPLMTTILQENQDPFMQLGFGRTWTDPF